MKCAVVLIVLFACVCCVEGQEAARQLDSNYNWKLATLGGTQFWTDVRIEGGWRIQRNSQFGHYRLLNPDDVREAWGTKPQCVAALETQIAAGTVQPYRGKVVILLHGLWRTWRSMQPMAKHLEEHGYSVILFRYASSRGDVAEHAKHLQSILDALPDTVTEINFVGHSLGNIVVRHYIADCQRAESVNLDQRLNRMVMIGPPNQGSRVARLLKDSVTFKLIAGASGAQLSGGWKDLEKNLATPKFEFGIVAGGYGSEEAPMSNILLPGKDDFTVSEWETMLPGADDFLVRPLLHSTMMHQEEVLTATTRFLQFGYFVSFEQRNPIDQMPPENRVEDSR